MGLLEDALRRAGRWLDILELSLSHRREVACVDVQRAEAKGHVDSRGKGEEPGRRCNLREASNNCRPSHAARCLEENGQVIELDSLQTGRRNLNSNVSH